MKALWIVWIIVRCVLYVLMHPRWSLRVWRGYQQYVNEGGSFLDTDFYKIPMGQLYWKRLRHLGVGYLLTIRDKDLVVPQGFGDRLRKKVDDFARRNHSISTSQRAWLDKLPFLDSDYLAYLADETQPKILAKHVKIKQSGGKLDVRIEGPVYQTTWWEIHLMKIISELYYEMNGVKPRGWDWIIRAWEKGVTLKKIGAIFSEFGTRRRFSFWVQFVVLLTFMVSDTRKSPQSKGGLIGTSNVFLAQLFGLTPIGTMAHELFMTAGAFYGHEKANRLIISLWEEEFGHELGYFLPDTYTSAKFYEVLTRNDALHFTGPRQDSGDPVAFTDLTIAFYKRVGLSDKQIAQKTIIYSDSLNVDKVRKLLAYARSKGIKAAFGIGTFLTNDVGPKHLNMVIKAYEVWLTMDPDNRRRCIKISDELGKITGDPETAKQVQHWLETGEILWEPIHHHTPLES